MSEPKRPRAQRNQRAPQAPSAQERGREREAKDIAILNGPTEDGRGARVVRIRDGEVSAGEIRPVREGESVNQSEVVRLRPLDQDERVCEVEVLHAPPQAADAPNAAKNGKDERSASPGPARVSTANYRKNWSTIFERQVDQVDQANQANQVETEGGAKKRPKSEWSVN